MEPFEWLVPADLPEAVEALQDPDSVALGGGQALLLMMKQSLVAPTRVVWLSRLQELRGIKRLEDGGIYIGAGTTIDEVSRSPLIREAYPVLSRAAGMVGNPRVRAAATVGGSVAHGDPCQDVPPVLCVLGATVHLESSKGRRTLPLDAKFFVDDMATAIEPGELVLGVELPRPDAGLRAQYVKFTPRSQEDYATVGVAAAVRVGGAGRAPEIALALGGVAATVVRVPTGDAAAHDAADVIAAISEAAVRASDPWDDQRGSAEYKRAMARVWTKRVLEEVWQ